MGKRKCSVEGLRFNRRGVEWRSADLGEAPAARRSFQTHREIASASLNLFSGGARSIVVVMAKGMPIKQEFGIYDPTVAFTVRNAESEENHTFLVFAVEVEERTSQLIRSSSIFIPV